jgi:adenylyltransferase/sulfurtransferase
MQLPELGVEGQHRLKAASVLLVGAGGLGSPVALYLAAAGVGRIMLVDHDAVDETNLQRQLLYNTSDVGRPKLDAARERLAALNPFVEVACVPGRFSVSNARELVAAADVVIDGTDNFPTRYLVNDACVLGGRPNVFGSIARFEGQAAVFALAGGPCYRCLHPEPPPSGLIADCGTAGVLGVLPGLIGVIQATEAIKLITGIGEPLAGRLFLYDALRLRAREIRLPRDPDCPVCGDTPTIRDLSAYEDLCVTAVASVAGPELLEWRRRGAPHLLVDVREPWEHEIRSIAGDLIVPMAELESRLALFPTDRPVIVYCQTGARSGMAAARLRARGIDARNLSGGIQAWPDL